MKWVKEHDLAHGQFINWLQSLKIDRFQAAHFIKIVEELQSNVGTYTHLGAKSLYLIATMPPEERDKPQQLSNVKVIWYS